MCRVISNHFVDRFFWFVHRRQRSFLKCISFGYKIIIQTQFIENVIWVFYKSRSLLDQEMTARTLKWVNASRYSKDFTTLLKSKGGRDQRSTPLSRFHNDNAPTKTANDSVTYGKVFGLRGCSQGKFGDHYSLLNNLIRKFFIGGRIDDIYARAQNGYCESSSSHATPVGRRIYPSGHATYHAQTTSSKSLSYLFSRFYAIGRRIPWTDHPDKGCVLRDVVAFYVQKYRWVMDLFECRWVGGIEIGDDPGTTRINPLEFLWRISGKFPVNNPLSHLSSNTLHLPQLRDAGLKYLLRAAKFLQQIFAGNIPKAWNHLQGNPLASFVGPSLHGF